MSEVMRFVGRLLRRNLEPCVASIGVFELRFETSLSAEFCWALAALAAALQKLVLR